jgi:hypothetical protein
MKTLAALAATLLVLLVWEMVILMEMWPTDKSAISKWLPGFQIALYQGCQIFRGTKYQNEEKYTKLPQNIMIGRKIYQMAVK